MCKLFSTFRFVRSIYMLMLTGAVAWFVWPTQAEARKIRCNQFKTEYNCEKHKKVCVWYRCGVCASKKVTKREACLRKFLKSYYNATLLGAGRCRYSNCFKYGWETRHRNGQTSTTSCNYSDCLKYGWQTRHPNGMTSNTSCNYSECLKYGWETRHPDNETTRTSCRYSNCTKYGWESRHPNGGSSTATCRYSKCMKYGWDLSMSNGTQYRCTCSYSDCLKNGADCN